MPRPASAATRSDFQHEAECRGPAPSLSHRGTAKGSGHEARRSPRSRRGPGFRLRLGRARGRSRRFRRRGPRTSAHAGGMRGHRRALPRREPLPQPRRDGPARLRPRRVPVLRLSAARPRSAACATALYPRLAPIANALERAHGHRRRATRPSTPSSSRAATPPARRGRRRCCCSTGRATTTACTRISTASSCSRCRWRSCCRSRARISPAASSC